MTASKTASTTHSITAKQYRAMKPKAIWLQGEMCDKHYVLISLGQERSMEGDPYMVTYTDGGTYSRAWWGEIVRVI